MRTRFHVACIVCLVSWAAATAQEPPPAPGDGLHKRRVDPHNRGGRVQPRDTAEDLVYDNKMWLSNGYYTTTPSPATCGFPRTERCGPW